MTPVPQPTPQPTHTIRIEPAGLVYTARADQTVLEAALAAGLDVPRSCRNGTCRACMGRLISGQIRYRIEWPGLSPDEKDEGLILPCVAQPLSDLVLQLPEARVRA